MFWLDPAVVAHVDLACEELKALCFVLVLKHSAIVSVFSSPRFFRTACWGGGAASSWALLLHRSCASGGLFFHRPSSFGKIETQLRHYSHHAPAACQDGLERREACGM